MAVAACWVCWVWRSTPPVNVLGGGVHGDGACGERAGGLGDGPDDVCQAPLHLLHGAGQCPDLIRGTDVERGAGKISGGDGGGAAGDQADAAGDAPGEEGRDDAADYGTENGGGPQRDEDG